MDGVVRYALQDDTWFIKLFGEVCHPLGSTLNGLVNKALAESKNAKFVIDLSDAETIDSTCLGILSRLATRPNANTKPIIITGGGLIATALLVVRFDLLFVLVDSATSPIPNQLRPAPTVSSVEQQDILYLLLDAHRRLCAIDAQTNVVFRDVVEAMEADMAASSVKCKHNC